MSASLSDLFNAAQNIATALNNYSQTLLNINGSTNVTNISSATVVKLSAGRIATVSVLVAGSTTGRVYDATSTSNTNYPLYVIPNTVGIYVVNMPAVYGIVVAPGTSQTVSVSFS